MTDLDTTRPPGVLQPSRVLEKCRRGEVASCTKINLSDSRVVEIAALAGLDAVWLDTEHVANSIRDIEQSVYAARAGGCDALVRVPRGSYSDLIRPLEVGAAGVIVPHVVSAEDARWIVRHTRFHPLGRRPLDGGNADGAFTGLDFESYVQAANRNRMVIVQIEDPEAMDELDAIAAVDGIDALFFGPGDFAHGLGVPGRGDDPRIDDARRRVARVAREHGRFAATVGSLDTRESLIEMGYQIVSIGADVVSLRQNYKRIAGAFTGTAERPDQAGPYRA